MTGTIAEISENKVHYWALFESLSENNGKLAHCSEVCFSAQVLQSHSSITITFCWLGYLREPYDNEDGWANYAILRSEARTFFLKKYLFVHNWAKAQLACLVCAPPRLFWEIKYLFPVWIVKKINIMVQITFQAYIVPVCWNNYAHKVGQIIKCAHIPCMHNK